MRQLPLTLHFAALLTVGSLLAGCGGSGDTKNSDPPPATDTTPPFTLATPAGGLYPEIQVVTLASDEPATIYYTIDGSDPSPEGVTTLSGPSPIAGLPVAHPLTLKFYGVDTSGNQEMIQEEIYDLDLDPPTVLLMGSPPTTLGWMEASTIVFSSDEDGVWSAELGGTGTPETGTPFASGTVQANTLTNLLVGGWLLDIGQMVRMDLYVFDAAGGYGRLTFDYQSLAATSFPLAGNSGEIAVTPDGRFLFVLRPDEAQVWQYDVAPPNPTHAQLAVFDVGANPTSLAVTPDSRRVYVTCDQEIFVVEVDLDYTVTPILMPAGVTPSGIGITPDGRLAYFICDDGYLRALNVNPTSGEFHQLTRLDEDYEPTRTAGHLAITPAGDKAVMVWTGADTYGVKVLDTDSTHLGGSYQRIIGTPITTTARPPVVAPPSISADGSTAYFGSVLGKLSRMDLSAPPFQIQVTNSMISATPSASSSGGEFLMLFGGGLEGVRLAEPFSLFVFKTVPSGSTGGTGTGDFFAYSADGSRGYLVRDQGALTGEMWVLTLTQ